MKKPLWAVMPFEHYEGAVDAVKELTEDDKPFLSDELEPKIRSIVARPTPIEDCRRLFENAVRIGEINNFNFSNVTNAYQMFYNAEPLTEVPEMNLENCTTCQRMFGDNATLLSIPHINARNAKNFSGFCNKCPQLRTTNGFDVENGENFDGAFEGCSLMCGDENGVFRFNSKNGKSFKKFMRCQGYSYTIKRLEVDTSSAEYLNEAFVGQNGVVSIGTLDLTNAIDISDMFLWGGGALTTVDNLIFGTKLKNTNNAFYWAHVTDCKASGTIPVSISLASSPLTAESAITFINALADYSGTDKEGTQTLTLSATTKTNLENEGATAPNGLTWLDYIGVKGWLYA